MENIRCLAINWNLLYHHNHHKHHQRNSWKSKWVWYCEVARKKNCAHLKIASFSFFWFRKNRRMVSREFLMRWGNEHDVMCECIVVISVCFVDCVLSTFIDFVILSLRGHTSLERELRNSQRKNVANNIQTHS